MGISTVARHIILVLAVHLISRLDQLNDEWTEYCVWTPNTRGVARVGLRCGKIPAAFSTSGVVCVLGLMLFLFHFASEVSAQTILENS